MNESFMKIGRTIVEIQAWSCRRPWYEPRPSLATTLDVCEWGPEGLYDKSASLIPSTDEIFKLF